MKLQPINFFLFSLKKLRTMISCIFRRWDKKNHSDNSVYYRLLRFRRPYFQHAPFSATACNKHFEKKIVHKEIDKNNIYTSIYLTPNFLNNGCLNRFFEFCVKVVVCSGHRGHISRAPFGATTWVVLQMRPQYQRPSSKCAPFINAPPPKTPPLDPLKAPPLNFRPIRFFL